MDELDALSALISGTLIVVVMAVQIGAVVTSLVCGIGTAVKHKSSFFMGTALTVLGFRCIFSILSSIPVTMLMVRAANAGSLQYVTYAGVINTFLPALLEIAVIVLFCMHFIRRYQIGTVHMIVAIAARILSIATGIGSNYALASFITKKLPVPVFLSVRLLSIMILAVMYIAMIRLFLTAKEKEPARKVLFVFPLIIMINAVVSNILGSLFSGVISRAATGTSELMLIVLPAVSGAAVLVGSIYIIRTAGAVSAENPSRAEQA